MTTKRLELAAVIASALLVAEAATAWEYTRPGGPALAVLAAPDGSVVSAGLQGSDPIEMVVVGHAGADGSERWRYRMTLGAPTYNSGASLVHAGPGSLFSASRQRERYGRWTGVMAKLAPVSGEPIWRVDLPDIGIRSIVLDHSGDVILAGGITEPVPEDLVVLKLSESDGHEIWRHVVAGPIQPGEDVARSVAVDAAGDVYVTGSTQNDHPSLGDFLVLKVSGETGSELWRVEIESEDAAGRSPSTPTRTSSLQAGSVPTRAGSTR